MVTDVQNPVPVIVLTQQPAGILMVIAHVNQVTLETIARVVRFANIIFLFTDVHVYSRTFRKRKKYIRKAYET